MPATSHAAVRCGRCSRAILGIRRATCSARAAGALPGSGSARTSPEKTSRPEPRMTGWRCVVIEPPKTCGVTCASVVQPEWKSRHA